MAVPVQMGVKKCHHTYYDPVYLRWAGEVGASASYF